MNGVEQKNAMPADPRRRVVLGSGLGLGAMAAAGLSLVPSSVFSQAATPRAGGTLRVGVPGSSADSLDPHRTQGQSGDIVRFTNLFDGLSEYAPDSSVRLVLAESMTPNAASTEWTVKLRRGVKLHSGREFNADDLIFSVRRILDKANPTKGAALIAFVDPAALDKVDNYTVRFRLQQPLGSFMDVWANRYLRMVPSGFDPAKPVGTGPFKMESFSPGQESVFVRFDDYFREKAYVDRLQVATIGNNTAAINALRGGQMDIIFTMPFSEARAIQNDAKLRILNNPSALALQIYMKTDVAPFDDLRVRQAMRLIANRKQMVAVALSGYGTVGNDMAGRTVAPCAESTIAQREQDIAQARKLLSEAGKTNLNLEMVTVNGTAGMVECAQVFAEQAKAAGVTIRVRVMEVAAYLANYGKWPLGVDFLTDTYLPIATRSLIPTGTFNTAAWNDKEFIDLHAKAMGTSNAAERCAVIAKMRAIEHERGGYILWGFANVLNAYQANVQGLEPYTVDSALYSLRKVWLAS